MKIFRYCSLLLLCLIGTMAAKADIIIVDGIKYDKNDADLTAVVVGYISDTDNSDIIIVNPNNPSVPEAKRRVSAFSDTYSVEIPEKIKHEGREYSVVSIAENAFNSKAKLESITIPCTVRKIGNNAFYNCISLKTVVCNIDSPLCISESVFQYVTKAECELYVSPKSINSYREASVWKDFILKTNNTKGDGDVNGDGKVNAQDIVTLVSILNEKIVNSFGSAADVDGDGSITCEDVKAVADIIVSQ